jgi:hypothetical protein
MNVFFLKNVSSDDLLLIYNCINEAIFIFEMESQFAARIGVDRNHAIELRSIIRKEIDSREEVI